MRLYENEERFGDRALYKLLSSNVKFYREHHRNPKYFNKKLSQLACAEEAQISRSLLSSIESRSYYIEFSIAVLNRLSKVCNIPISWYFLETPPEEFYKS